MEISILRVLLLPPLRWPKLPGLGVVFWLAISWAGSAAPSTAASTVTAIQELKGILAAYD